MRGKGGLSASPGASLLKEKCSVAVVHGTLNQSNTILKKMDLNKKPDELPTDYST